MKNILFINTKKAQCSIYEAGKMFFKSIVSSEFSFTYIEIDKLDKEKLYNGIVQSGDDIRNFDYYIFNYHPITMRNVEGIDSSKLKNFKGKTISLILEMNKDEPFPKEYMLNENDFDEYIVLDPTFNTFNFNVHSFPRPLPPLKEIIKINQIPEIPIIGSFGLPGNDKNFIKILDQASKEFNKCIIRINIPSATYMHNELKKSIVNELLSNFYPNVHLQITHEYMSDDDLIEWCRGNHLNVFLYSRNSPGLSSVTDHVIAAGSPLLVSNSSTFRHLHPYISCFPITTFREAMLYSQYGIEKIRYDWSKNKCEETFKKIIYKQL